MSLRVKLLVILTFVAMLYISFDAGVQRYFLQSSFTKIEKVNAKRNMRRWLEAVNREIHHIDRLCFDWAAWDDIYQFALDGNDTFIHTNLGPSAFVENNLNIIYILNRQGGLVWGKAYDYKNEEYFQPPDFDANHWAATHPLLQHENRSSTISGILMTSLGPMLMASRPIMPSEGEGPPHGTLVMGQVFSQDLMNVLLQQTQLKVDMWALNRDTPPTEAKEILQFPVYESVHLCPQSPQKLYIYSVTPDVLGKPAILFRIDDPRDILNQGETAMRMDVFTMVAATLLVLVILMVLLRQNITGPLGALTRHVNIIGKGGELALYQGKPRKDEIGVLAREFNRMIRRVREEIGEHARVEDALRDNAARLNTIVAAAPDGIATTDESGTIESSNLEMTRMFGYEPGELEGKPVEILMTQDDRFLARKTIQHLLGDVNPAAVVDREIMALRKDGTLFPAHIRVAKVLIGDRTLFTGIARDITETREMQERLVQSKRLAALGEMGASIAHEIRNPLAGISGAVQVLLKDLPQDHKHWPVLREVQEAVERVEGTVQKLLDYARTWQPDPKRCLIMDLVREACAEAAGQPAFKQVMIRFDGDADTELMLDPLLVRRVIWNLLTNAADAMPDGGAILWTVADEGRFVSVTIHDSGCGMDSNTQRKLKEPFFTTKTHGTGLGLAICQRIMEAHRGRVEISSAPGAGTSVRLLFPRGE